MTRQRAAVALATVGLHAALLLAMVMSSAAVETAAPQSSVSVRLVAAAAPARQERVLAPAPQIAMPVAPSMSPPELHVAAPAAGPSAEAAPVQVALAIAPPQPRAPAAAAAPAEPEFQPALPPSRQCTEQTLARRYPPMLRERGVEGRVLLRVRVDEQGRAAEVRIERGSGWRLLDEAAQALTQDCRFVPAHRGGQALASWVEYPVSFALN